MVYLASDISLLDSASSPTPGPSNLNSRLLDQQPLHHHHSHFHSRNRSRGQEKNQDQFDDEDDLLTAYPTPPLSESEPFFQSRQSSQRRPRFRSSSSSIRPLSRSYRQPTLSECLNRCASSPLGHKSLELEESLDDFNDSSSVANLDSFDNHAEAHHLNQRPTLEPLKFYENKSKRLRLDPSLDIKASLLPSSDVDASMQTANQSWTGLNSPLPHPPRLNRSRITQTSHDMMDLEIGYRLPYSNQRRMGRIQSLNSDPHTQTIKMWHSEYESGHEFPFSLCFNHSAKAGESGTRPTQNELMAVASASGTISLYNPSAQGTAEDLSPVASFQGTKNGIFALSFSPSDLVLATGSGTQVSELFDVSTGSMIGKLIGHSGTVKTVQFSPHDDRILVTGSRDGSIKLWDLRVIGNREDGWIYAYPPVMTIKNAHDEKHTGRKRKKGAHIPSVSSVLWSQHVDSHLFSGGSANGIVKLWDIRKKTPFTSKTHPIPAEQSIEQSVDETYGYDVDLATFHNPLRPHGISSLVSSSDGARIYSLGTDSTIRTHDCLNLSRQPTSQLRSFKHPSLIATSLYLKLALSNDDRYLACSSSTGDVFIWDTQIPQDPLSYLDGAYHENEFFCPGDYQPPDGRDCLGQPIIFDGHSKEICGLDFWRQGLGSCSDDSLIKIWTYSDAYLERV